MGSVDATYRWDRMESREVHSLVDMCNELIVLSRIGGDAKDFIMTAHPAVRQLS